MLKKLDLSVFQMQTWEVTLLDGTVLHIKKPSQSFLIEIEQTTKRVMRGEIEGVEEAFAMNLDICTSILNNNMDGKTIAQAYVQKEIPYEVQMVIISNYNEFAQEVMQNPN